MSALTAPQREALAALQRARDGLRDGQGYSLRTLRVLERLGYATVTVTPPGGYRRRPTTRLLTWAAAITHEGICQRV